MFLRLGNDGWCCVTKGKMFFPLEGFCWSASFLFSKCISERVRVIKFCGYPLFVRCFWNSSSRFWKFSFEEFVLSNKRASPFMKPFLTPNGWQDVKCVYWNVSLGLKCHVPTSRIDVLLDRFPLWHNCIQKCDFVLRDFCCGVVIMTRGWKAWVRLVKPLWYFSMIFIWQAPICNVGVQPVDV